MKIAIASTTPDLSGNVEHKLGTAAFILVIETDDMTFEVLNGPPSSSGSGAGVQMVSLVMNMDSQAILVGFMSPHIAEVVSSQGIEVIDRVDGSVADVVEKFILSRTAPPRQEEVEPLPAENVSVITWSEAISKTGRQFLALFPLLVAVILLLGLFQGFVSEQTLLSFFSGSNVQDSFLGACIGSLMAGNPINSYVIGESLQKAGVGLPGAAALMLAWVSVGFIQLPAEATALGWRFALVRNLSGFAMAAIMALCLTFCMGLWI